ncbi:MAG: hypothetical protein HOO93_15630 [Methyloglobulus sp.]|nr:hypothetical protein [Methyloglobulus sp.]
MKPLPSGSLFILLLAYHSERAAYPRYFIPFPYFHFFNAAFLASFFLSLLPAEKGDPDAACLLRSVVFIESYQKKLLFLCQRAASMSSYRAIRNKNASAWCGIR